LFININVLSAENILTSGRIEAQEDGHFNSKKFGVAPFHKDPRKRATISRYGIKDKISTKEGSN